MISKVATLVATTLALTGNAAMASDQENIQQQYVKEHARTQVETCSRDIARKVRSYLQKEVYPKLDFPALELPDACQLNPKFDTYLDQEQHKAEVSRNDWQCLYCRKHFKNQFYLDRHMSLKHRDKLLSNTTVCLADLCPVFGCHTLERQAKRAAEAARYQHDPIPDLRRKNFLDVEDERCSEAEVEKNRYRCEVMLRRCFDSTRSSHNRKDSKTKATTTSTSATKMSHYDMLYDQICEKIQCKGGRLKGSLIDVQEEEPSVVWWVLQVLCITMIVFIALFYTFSADLPMFETITGGISTLLSINFLQNNNRKNKASNMTPKLRTFQSSSASGGFWKFFNSSAKMKKKC